eukprot:GFUD01001032.1.p1 GENE.GFUD01001032.1~~GFUD01001032.1.p1  ORF type:complete len:621 (-),score=131.42 GFUD01001032.1:437-2299(-)
MAVICEEDSFGEDGSVSSFDWSDAETEVNNENNAKPENKGGRSFCLSAAVAQCRQELVTFLAQLYRSVYLSDLVIHCQGGKLPAHRLLLCKSRLLYALLESEIADIYLMDFDVSSVVGALQLVYTGSITVRQADLERTKHVLKLLGFQDFEVIKLKDPKKKKDKLKVKHEKNLSSRKAVTDTKPQVIRKKRVLMANLDPYELSCDICHKSFSALYKLKMHKMTHSSFFPFICAECGKGFNNKYKMHAHEKKHIDGVLDEKPKPDKPVSPPKPIKQYQCNECTEIFSMVKDLKRHTQLTHNVKEPITCIHCATICRSQKTLITHLKVVHNDHDSGLKCCCGVCGKKFLKLSNLEDHIMRHNTIKHFACMYCPKRCATKQDLDRHLRSHSGEASMVCQICSRAFVHRKTYVNHLRKHLGQKPYHCKPCNKNFGALNTLKKHQNSHQRKGDQTRIVTATKGSRGADSVTVSYIESFTVPGPATAAVHSVHKVTTPIYIPGPHYIQTDSSITPLCQMQVISDYTDVSRIPYDPPPLALAHPIAVQPSSDLVLVNNQPVETPSQTRNMDCLYSSGGYKKPQHRALANVARLERDCVEDTDSRDDGYILGLFESQPCTTQTTLEKL